MTTINQPTTTVTLSNASELVDNTDQRVLICGQKTSAGSQAALTVVTNIDNSGIEDELFGPTSQVARMVRSFKLVNPHTRLDVIALDDNGGGSAATGTFTITQTPAPTLVSNTTNLSLLGNLGITSSGTEATFFSLNTEHGYQTGDLVTITGSGQPNLDVADKAIVRVDGLSFTYQITDNSNNPSDTQATAIRVQDSLTGGTLAEDDGITTATFAISHGYAVGDVITVTDADQDGFNGSFTVIEVSSAAIFTCKTRGTGTATGTILFEQYTSNPGTLELIVASARNYTFEIAVLDGDQLVEVTKKIIDVVALETQFPYILDGSTAGTLLFTAVNIGEVANNEAFQFTNNAPDLTVGIVTTAGALDPVTTGIFPLINGTRYQGILWPWASSSNILATEMDARFNTTGTLLDGVGFIPFVGSSNEVNLQTTDDSPSVVYICDNDTEVGLGRGASMLEITFVAVVMFLGIRAVRTDGGGVNITNFVITSSGALDSFGGPALASKPYFNTPLSNIDPSPIGFGFFDTEIEDIKDGGATTFGNDVSGLNVIMGEIVTTSLTVSTFQFLNTVDTSSNVREYMRNNLQNRFSQSRLVEGDTVPGRDMANAAVIIAFTKRLYLDLSGPDFVLVESGAESLSFFEDNLTVTIDKTTGTATILMTVLLVVQLRRIQANIEIALSANS